MKPAQTSPSTQSEGKSTPDAHPAAVVGRRWLVHGIRAAISVVISFLLLWLLPKLDPSSDLLTHMAAKAQSLIVGGFYPAQARDRMTVVLIDDKTLEDSGEGWPLPYHVHARWLRNIGELYQPKAIFWDITFSRRRADDSMPQLLEAFCHLQQQGIPVFLATLQDTQTGAWMLHPDLVQPQGQTPCFTPVSVRFDPHSVDQLVWNYPLWSNAARWAEQWPASAFQPSAALALAQKVGATAQGVQPQDPPMTMVWGADSTPLRPYSNYCRQTPGGLRELVPPGIRLWWDDQALLPACPYSRAIAMHEMFNPSDALLEQLQGQILMVGGNLSGANDSVNSPAHHLIPGVFLHAMALDNLLTYGDAYKQALNWEMPPSGPLLWLGIATVLLVHIGRVAHDRSQIQRRLRTATKRRLRQAAWMDWLVGRAGQHSRFPRLSALLHVLGAGLYRVVVIAISLLTVSLFIVGVQKYSNVGVLPLVDLALFALAAEWTGATNKIFDLWSAGGAHSTSTIKGKP